MWVNCGGSLGQDAPGNDWLSPKKPLFAVFCSPGNIAANGGTKDWYSPALHFNSYDTCEGRAGAKTSKLQKKKEYGRQGANEMKLTETWRQRNKTKNAQKIRIVSTVSSLF